MALNEAVIVYSGLVATHNLATRSVGSKIPLGAGALPPPGVHIRLTLRKRQDRGRDSEVSSQSLSSVRFRVEDERRWRVSNSMLSVVMMLSISVSFGSLALYSLEAKG